MCKVHFLHIHSVKSRNNTTLSLRKAHTEGNDSHSLKPWRNCSSAEKTKAQSKERPGYESEQERGPRVETCCQATVPYRPAKLGSLGFCFYFLHCFYLSKKDKDKYDQSKTKSGREISLPPVTLFRGSSSQFPQEYFPPTPFRWLGLSSLYRIPFPTPNPSPLPSQRGQVNLIPREHSAYTNDLLFWVCAVVLPSLEIILHLRFSLRESSSDYWGIKVRYFEFTLLLPDDQIWRTQCHSYSAFLPSQHLGFYLSSASTYMVTLAHERYAIKYHSGSGSCNTQTL